MKSIKLLIAGMLIFITTSLFSQVTILLGTPPAWGPAGYSNVQYYYLPDVESYYDVQNSKFIYYERGAWVRRATLPNRYRTYDLYSGYKVVMTDYRGNAPYAHHKEYKVKYKKGYKGPHQNSIGPKPGNHNSAVKHQNKRVVKKSQPKNPSRGHGNAHNNGGAKGKNK